MPDDWDSVRELIAQGCRVLAERDLAPGILGHSSVRVDDLRLGVRCRGPQERGLAFTTTADDIKAVTFDGDEGRPGELAGGYTPPHELPLHAETLHHRPDIDCVVHAHPQAVVAADLAGIEIRPIVGAYDIPGSALARAGIPVHPPVGADPASRSGSGDDRQPGSKSAVVLRGHGMTVVGASVQEAVLRNVSIGSIATLSLAVRQAGGTLVDISEVDAAELPDLGGSITRPVGGTRLPDWSPPDPEIVRADNQCAPTSLQPGRRPKVRRMLCKLLPLSYSLT